MEDGAAETTTTHRGQEPSSPGLISVILPAYNAADTLPRQLEALASQSYRGPWELLVVDNRSTDPTGEVARRWADRFPSFRVVEAEERQGINYARNAGAGAARGDLLLFCDADDVAAPGWLEAMARAAPGCDLVGGRLDEAALNDPLTHAWRPTMPDHDLPRALGFLPYAVGANCGVRAEVLRELGGFDERYARGAADIEFFWRAQLASYRLCYVPDAVIRYQHRQGLGPLWRQFYRYGRAEPQLFAAFRRAGVRRSGLAEALLNWAWIVWHLPDLLRSPTRRGIWVRKAAYRAGRLAGSLRFRVLFP